MLFFIDLIPKTLVVDREIIPSKYPWTIGGLPCFDRISKMTRLSH